MNSKMAKKLRAKDPSRPNPGRKNGGINKMNVKSMKIEKYVEDKHHHMIPVYETHPEGQEDTDTPRLPDGTPIGVPEDE